MTNESKIINMESGDLEEKFTVRMTDPMLYDRIHILSTEYSVSVEALVNVAVKRLLNDVDFVRNLRIGKMKSE